MEPGATADGQERCLSRFGNADSKVLARTFLKNRKIGRKRVDHVPLPLRPRERPTVDKLFQRFSNGRHGEHADLTGLFIPKKERL